MANDFDGLTPCSEHINEPVYSWSWLGAMLLAKRIISIIQLGNAAFKKPKNIINLLEFLLKNKMDMLNFIYNDGMDIGTVPIKDKKGKIKEYKPYKLIWEVNTPKKTVEELTFITPNENKWRDTAKILLEAFKQCLHDAEYIYSKIARRDIQSAYQGARYSERGKMK